MTAYWKRFLISVGVVTAAFLPAMIRDFQNTVVVGPWLGVLFAMERFEIFRGLHLATPTWSVILGLLTPTVLAIASRRTQVAVLATLFFLLEALFMYALMGADLGHAMRTSPPKLF